MAEVTMRGATLFIRFSALVESRGHLVPDQVGLVSRLAHGDLNNLIRQIWIVGEFPKHFGKQDFLRFHIHPRRYFETDQARMKGNVGQDTLGPWCLLWTAKILAVPGYEYPILTQKDFFEFPVLPSRLADPGDVGRFGVPMLPSHQSKFSTKAFIDEQLGHADLVMVPIRLEISFAPGGKEKGICGGLPR